MRKIPFGLIKGDAFRVYTPDGRSELPLDWSGVCSGVKPTDFWYLGRDPVTNERSYNRLRSHNYETALLEAGIYEQQQRLRAGAATVDSFERAVVKLFNGDPIHAMKAAGKFLPCSSQEVLDATKAPRTMGILGREQLQSLQDAAKAINDRAMLEEVSLEEWADFQVKQDQAMDAYADTLVFSKTFCGLSAESATQRWVLSPSANKAGVWQVTVFSPKDMPWGHTEYGDVRAAIFRVLEESNFQNVQAYHAPIKTSDAACMIQDTLYFMVDRIQAGKECAVLMRELCKHYGEAILNPGDVGLLVGQLKAWEGAPRGSAEQQVYHEAVRRASLFYGIEHEQHLFAYAVEEAMGMGIEPSMSAPKGTVDGWLSQVEVLADRFYRALSAESVQLSPQDLVDFAYAISKMDHPEVGCDVRRIIQEARESTLADASLEGKELVGYYVQQHDAKGFLAHVRNSAGDVVMAVHGGSQLGQGEASLVDFGFMANYYDLDGLQQYMQGVGALGGNGMVLMGDDLDQRMEAVDTTRSAPQVGDSLALG